MINSRTFATQQEAYSWMSEEVDDPYTDNFRFTYADDAKGMEVYHNICAEGCCGFFDADVTVAGRAAIVGCNYGH